MYAAVGLVAVGCAGGCDSSIEVVSGSTSSASSGSTVASAASTGTGSSSASTGSGGEGGSGGSGGAPSTNVITVVDEKGAPVAGVDLFVSDASGVITQSLATDAGGAANADIPPSGMIVMPVPATGTPPQLFDLVYAFFDPPVGAPIRFVRPTTPVNANPPSDFVLSYSGWSGPAASVRYMLPCTGGPFTAGAMGTQTISGYAGCPGETTFDVAAVARDDYQHVLAWGVIPHGGSFSSGPNLPTVALDQTTTATVTSHLINPPPGALYYVTYQHGERNGHAYAEDGVPDTMMPTGPVNTSVEIPLLFDHYLVAHRIWFTSYEDKEWHLDWRCDRFSAPPFEATWDASTMVASPVQPVDADFATSTLVYQLGEGTVGDIALVEVKGWAIGAPPAQTPRSITLPPLPAPYAGMNFNGGGGSLQVIDMDLDEATGYADALAMGANSPSGGCTSTVVPLPAPGSASVRALNH